MKQVVRNAAFEAFVDATEALAASTRIKDVREQPLRPGGRVSMTLFESVDGGRPHPRMQFAYVDIDDPAPPASLFDPEVAPRSAGELRQAMTAAQRGHAEVLATGDLGEDQAPPHSPRYWRNQIRVSRCRAMMAEIRAQVEGWLSEGTLPAAERTTCHRAVAEFEDELYTGPQAFDDADTGTYHSYGHDAPFVHYLEALLGSLPVEGSAAMAVLPSATRESVRRQRDQVQAHLDWLMLHKYANEVIEERDIERTLGGFLIDRRTRQIASERADSDPLAPRYELLKIAPTAEHPDAGQWLYRDAAGRLHRADHSPVEVEPEDLRHAPLDLEQLTFQRAPGDPNLREGLRFDWDGDGWVQQGEIDWVSWAGHCDVKAVMEELGVTMTAEPRPSVREYRSDTGDTIHYDRDLLLEMLASVMELGSLYRRIDGTGRLQRGIHEFGGSRNDSRPDRLQFTGTAPGRSFRWPMGGRHETFRVTGIELPDGERPDMGTVFFRDLPDLEAVRFTPNPRYVKTVEGDYNIIDVTGARLEARVLIDVFDAHSGYPVQRTEQTMIDLREGADAGETGRFFLGTHVDDVGKRQLFRVYYEPANRRIVAEMQVYEQVDGRWVARPRPGLDVEVPLQAPLRCTLSREMKRDDPSQFTALLQLASREARNICADTDKESAVWNGVVTHLDVTKKATNADERTEHWHVDIVARFGEAKLEYLVRRDERGQPEAYCPATSDHHWGHWPDFLWHDVPDVGSKGVENGEWVVNETMVDRELVKVRVDPSVPSGFYVYDDHVKNVFELMFAGLAGYGYTVVHDNKRYGFRAEAPWAEAVARLEQLRAAVSFEDA